jgi:hypothetical protein
MLPRGVYPFTREALGLALAIALAIAAGFLLRKFLRARVTPEDAERVRRLDVNSKGKLGDGEILDFEGATIVYSYHVAGVGYTAAQHIMALADLLPADRMSMIGPALVKFDPRNPANSIVLCEEWSGLRRRERDVTR